MERWVWSSWCYESSSQPEWILQGSMWGEFHLSWGRKAVWDTDGGEASCLYFPHSVLPLPWSTSPEPAGSNRRISLAPWISPGIMLPSLLDIQWLPTVLRKLSKPLSKTPSLFSLASFSIPTSHQALPCPVHSGHPGLLSIPSTVPITTDCNELSSLLHRARLFPCFRSQIRQHFVRGILPMPPDDMGALPSHSPSCYWLLHSTDHEYVMILSVRVAFLLSVSITRMNGSSRVAAPLPTLFTALSPEPGTQEGSRPFCHLLLGQAWCSRSPTPL